MPNSRILQIFGARSLDNLLSEFEFQRQLMRPYSHFSNDDWLLQVVADLRYAGILAPENQESRDGMTIKLPRGT